MSQSTVVVSGYGLRLEDLFNVNDQLKLAMKEIIDDYDLMDDCLEKFNKAHKSELFLGLIVDDYELDGDGHYIYFPDIKPYAAKQILTKEYMYAQICAYVQLLLRQYSDEQGENYDELITSAINTNMIADKCYDILAVGVG